MTHQIFRTPADIFDPLTVLRRQNKKSFLKRRDRHVTVYGRIKEKHNVKTVGKNEDEVIVDSD